MARASGPCAFAVTGQALRVQLRRPSTSANASFTRGSGHAPGAFLGFNSGQGRRAMDLRYERRREGSWTGAKFEAGSRMERIFITGIIPGPSVAGPSRGQGGRLGG